MSAVKFKSRLLLTVLVLLIVAPLIGHYYLSKVCGCLMHKRNVVENCLVNVFMLQEEKDGFEHSYGIHSKLEANEDYGVLRATDLKNRITELVRIKSIYIILIYLPCMNGIFTM